MSQRAVPTWLCGVADAAPDALPAPCAEPPAAWPLFTSIFFPEDRIWTKRL